MTGHRKQLVPLDLFQRILLRRLCFTGINKVWNYKGQDRGKGGMVRLGFAVFTDGALAIIRESEFFIVLFASPRTSFPCFYPSVSEKPWERGCFRAFPWAPRMTSMKHTVTLIADFEAPLVDIHIAFERDFHCGPVNFQANFSRWQRPTNDNLFCGVTSLLNFDFYKVKFFTSLRILKLGKKG